MASASGKHQPTSRTSIDLHSPVSPVHIRYCPPQRLLLTMWQPSKRSVEIGLVSYVLCARVDPIQFPGSFGRTMNTLDLAAARRVVAEAWEIPSDMLKASGRALYSPAETLTAGSPIYFLGLNPGEIPGGSESHDLLTVGADLRRLESGEVIDHGYLDEKWKGNEAGCAPIQVRAKRLFSIIAGGDMATGIQLLRKTPVSNFVLRRSPNAQALEVRTHTKASDLAKQCWPFHHAVIRESNCSVVLTHAVGIARQFARELGLGEGEQWPSGYGGTLCTLYAWRLPEGPKLLAIPNLSRYNPYKKDGTPREELVNFIAAFGPYGRE